MTVYLITLGYFIFFILFYLRNRTNIFNGIIFLGLLGLVAISSLIYVGNSHNTFIYIVLAIIIGMVIFVLISSVFWIAVIAFYCAYMLFKKESKSLHNYLSLFLGLFILGWSFLPLIFKNEIFNYFYFYVNVIILYIAFMFTSFIFSSVIYQVYIPFKKVDYIIVLGSGLINGKDVSSLLASRIDKGIKIYLKQMERGHKPKLIMSGGQGSNELISEAYAMKEYAINKKIDEDDIILEDKSTNTYQNMLFSKEIINNPKAKVIFTTNNYHVYRAGIYAKRAKLHACGVGSSTKFYYWFNSIIREFIAVMTIYKSFNVIMVLLISFLYFLVIIIDKFNLFEILINNL